MPLFGQAWPKRAVWLAMAWWLFGLWCLFKPAGSESMPFPHYDKLGHFALFAVQAALLGVACGGRRLPAIWMALALWAGLSEWLQATLTQDRSGDPLDALADLAGASLVLGMLAGWGRARRVAPV